VSAPEAPRETDWALLDRMGTDATIWAQEFVRAATSGPREYTQSAGDLALDPTPGGFLHVWFCNAIEAGRAAGRGPLSSESAETREMPIVATLAREKYLVEETRYGWRVLDRTGRDGEAFT
jgi:hypothetical protein